MQPREIVSRAIEFGTPPRLPFWQNVLPDVPNDVCDCWEMDRARRGWFFDHAGEDDWGCVWAVTDTARNMGQVVLAQFNNSSGLNRVGGGLYQMSPNSGNAIVGAAGTTIPASLASGALEMSNVDLSEEFVNMIVAQRGFQANARVITTGDEMMTDMINLKR